MRVALFGGFGIGNFGNDASLEAMLAFLRAEHPEARLCCICSRPDVVAAKFGLPAHPTQIAPRGWLGLLNKALLRVPGAVASWIHCLWLLGRIDVILVAGASVFDDFRDSPLGWPARSLRWALAARLRGVPIRYVSVGAGPLRNPVSRAMMRWVAQLARARSYRDADSHAFMQRLGVADPTDAVLPDLAFLLPAPNLQPKPRERICVGVGVMTWRGWVDSERAYRAYLDLMERLLRWLDAEGFSTRVLIGQTPADLTAVRALEGRIGRALIGPDEANLGSIHDVMAAAADTDFVIASRYHVQIAALKMGRPVLSLSYAPKNDALMADAGLERFAQNLDAVDFERLAAHVRELAANHATLAEQVRAKVGAMSARLHGALQGLDLLKR